MIRSLAIRNLAVIESVAVDFEPGFNVLTGETGAGKSILVEAVGLLLGGRASPDMVRTGAEVAIVEAIFTAEGEEVSVRRELSASGRSRAFIDGNLATAAALRDLAARFVELHGQHDHQQLLDPAQHLAMLDAWAGNLELRQQVGQDYHAVAAARQRMDRARMDSRERAARLELIDFQLTELTKASLRPGEDGELMATRDVLRSAETVTRLCGDSYGDLYDDEQAVLARLGRVWKRVEELSAFDSRFAEHLDQRDGIKAQLSDLASALRDFADGIDASPERLAQVEERLALVERLKRKHGPTLEDVIARRDALAAERESLAGGADSTEALQERLTAACARFVASASALSERRRTAAAAFTRSLEAELAVLAMERSRVEVRLVTEPAETSWTEEGIDAGEFYLSANPGEDPRPLARIASGGELSRVMLAIRTLSAGERRDRTLIFDEVDAGIGGRVASVVGAKLAQLGGRFQVLCITHLPAIAAAGAAHFFIEKRIVSGRTVTAVTALDDQARLREIARMIGGAGDSERARAAAHELVAATRRAGPRPTGAKGESRAPGRKRK